MRISAEHADLRRKMNEFQKYIEDQELLLPVLERDGHNVEAERAKLKIERAKLARLIAQELDFITKEAV
ncbi:hypothetical protein [uncultured Bradyrhizobium sp.]|uniref:hypothetical protein n=1 Tax=uncultured Bradyrhizobium sp. TaxID=199684 RepID=UPI00261281DA|nr:hypothetical protein [uncultured Bradyrhizobium sp.]